MYVNVRYFKKYMAARIGDVTNSTRTQNNEIKNG
jgi:hypothetical protein